MRGRSSNGRAKRPGLERPDAAITPPTDLRFRGPAREPYPADRDAPPRPLHVLIVGTGGAAGEVVAMLKRAGLKPLWVGAVHEAEAAMTSTTRALVIVPPLTEGLVRPGIERLAPRVVRTPLLVLQQGEGEQATRRSVGELLAAASSFYAVLRWPGDQEQLEALFRGLID